MSSVRSTTPDPAAAQQFYGELFGWVHEDIPAAGCTVSRLGATAVAGMFEQPPEQRGQMPPSWLSYVSVKDAEETAGRARELGGAVLREAADAMDAGRVAVLADPQGAVFALWQPLKYAGAGLVNDPGAFALNQLTTSDPEAAQRFYSDLFGWRVEFTGTPEQDYWGLYNGDALNGAMMPLPPGSAAPPHWLAYFTSDDLDGGAARIEALGGRVVVPITPIDVGRILVARDPQDATFALFEGEVDP